MGRTQKDVNQKDLQDLIKGKKRRGNKSSKKAGRNKKRCEFYRLYRYHNNKLGKLNKHISLHPNDDNAKEAIKRLYEKYKG